MKSEVNSLQKCLDRIHLQCQGGAGCILTGRRLEYRLIVLGPLPEPSNWHIWGSSIFEAPPFCKKGLEILFERYFEAQCSYYSSYNRYTNWLAPEVSLRVSIGRRISGDWAAFWDRAFSPNDHWSSLWGQNCGIPYFKSWKIGFRVVQSSEVSREGSQ